MTIVSMSWFRELARGFALSPSDGEDLTSWARNQLRTLEAHPQQGCTWQELAELEERDLRPKVESADGTRGALVLRYLDRLLAAESARLAPLNDWLLTLGVLADPKCVDNEVLDRLGAQPLKAEFLKRCPGGLAGLFARLRPRERDDWDKRHCLIWEPDYELETPELWDGIHPPLVSSVLLHDVPKNLTSGAAARRFSDLVADQVDLEVGVVDWDAIRADLGL